MQDEILFLTEEAREDYQRHLAIGEAVMGNYQDDSDATGYTEERGPGRVENLPPLPKGGTDGFHYAGGEGIVGPVDVEAETVRPKGMGFGGMEESMRQQQEAFEWRQMDEAMQAEKEHRLHLLDVITRYINANTKFTGSGKNTAYDTAIDAAYELYQYLKNT